MQFHSYSSLFCYITEFEELNKSTILELRKWILFEARYQFVMQELNYVDNMMQSCIHFPEEEILQSFRRYMDLMLSFQKLLPEPNTYILPKMEK